MERYKLLMVIPAVALLLSLGYIIYLVSGPGLLLDIDLKGGTQISIDSVQAPDLANIEKVLAEYHPTVRSARNLAGYTTIIDADASANSTDMVEKLRSAGYSFDSYSAQTVGPALGASFFMQAQVAMVLAFIFMAITVFIVFRIPTPSFYVILSAFADIAEAFAVSQFIGIKLSLATFTALLLLIGYSVDTDILLTTRVLKSEGEINDKINRAVKTGMTMLATTGTALLALFVMNASSVITQIASILLIGLVFDVINTWITNAGLLRWYIERKGKRNGL
jgi:preprotein translocase subunit SecF